VRLIPWFESTNACKPESFIFYSNFTSEALKTLVTEKSKIRDSKLISNYIFAGNDNAVAQQDSRST